MPRFSANLGHLFTEYPLIERIGAAAKAGFKAIELQFPYEVAPSAVKAEIDRHGLTMLNINTPPAGGRRAPGRGGARDASGSSGRTFTQALDYVTAIGGTSIHSIAGTRAAERAPRGREGVCREPVRAPATRRRRKTSS